MSNCYNKVSVFLVKNKYTENKAMKNIKIIAKQVGEVDIDKVAECVEEFYNPTDGYEGTQKIKRLNENKMSKEQIVVQLLKKLKNKGLLNENKVKSFISKNSINEARENERKPWKQDDVEFDFDFDNQTYKVYANVGIDVDADEDGIHSDYLIEIDKFSLPEELMDKMSNGELTIEDIKEGIREDAIEYIQNVIDEDDWEDEKRNNMFGEL